MSTANKGKIGVLVEEHFDETEYHRFNEFFPTHGYEVEHIPTFGIKKASRSKEMTTPPKSRLE